MIGVRGLARALLLLAALAASGGQAEAIDGGALARRGDALARSTVGIGTLVESERGIGLTRCSGVLVAPDLVLTAAHCVRDDPLAAIAVLFDGSAAVAPPYRVAAVARYDVQESDLPDEFLAQLQQLSLDTALLRLARPVRGRPNIRPAALRQPPRRLRLAGAGLSAEGTGTLKTATLEPVLFTSSGLIIARAPGARICSGDSGGPVVADGPRGPVLWGVASAVLTRTPPCGGLVVIAPAGLALGR